MHQCGSLLNGIVTRNADINRCGGQVSTKVIKLIYANDRERVRRYYVLRRILLMLHATENVARRTLRTFRLLLNKVSKA